MEIKNCINIFLKRKWFILLLPLTAAVISAVISLYFINTVYEAKTTMYVVDRSAGNNKELRYDDILAGNMLAKDYRELIKSKTVTEAVINQLNLKGLKPSELADRINIELKKDTRILGISVFASSAQEARDIANKVAEVFENKLSEITKSDTINIIDAAETPEAPSKPRPVVNTAIAFFAGLVTALSLALIMEFMNDTIKNSEDVEKYMGVSVLGVIPLFKIE